MDVASVAALNLNPSENTKRVYCDISETAYLKLRLRAAQLGMEQGKTITRKAYIEYLIEQDVANVKGAGLRIIEHRIEQRKPRRNKK